MARLQGKFWHDFFCYEFSSEKCSEFFSEFVEPLFCGSEKSRKIPAKLPTTFPCENKKHSPTSFCRSTGRISREQVHPKKPHAPRKSPEECTSLSLALCNAPSLHTSGRRKEDFWIRMSSSGVGVFPCEWGGGQKVRYVPGKPRENKLLGGILVAQRGATPTSVAATPPCSATLHSWQFKGDRCDRAF